MGRCMRYAQYVNLPRGTNPFQDKKSSTQPTTAFYCGYEHQHYLHSSGKYEEMSYLCSMMKQSECVKTRNHQHALFQMFK